MAAMEGEVGAAMGIEKLSNFNAYLYTTVSPTKLITNDSSLVFSFGELSLRDTVVELDFLNSPKHQQCIGRFSQLSISSAQMFSTFTFSSPPFF